MRHAHHFSHLLTGFVEFGLVRFQDLWRVFFRRRSDEPAIDINLETERKPSERRQQTRHDDHEWRQYDRSSGSAVTLDVNRLEKKKLIISVHVPKTGGTVFRHVLKTVAQEVFYLDYRSGRVPTAVKWRGKRIGTQHESIPDPDSLPGRSFIHGHFPVSKYTSRFPNAIYVTWLRDPVDRVASHYFYWRQTPYPDDPEWNKVVAAKMSLEQFARTSFARDLQHRILCPLGVGGFAFIGITEEYERSIELFRRLIYPNVPFDKLLKNRSPNRPTSFYELDLRKKILKLNERDVYTYVDGLRRFRRLCDQVGI